MQSPRQAHAPQQCFLLTQVTHHAYRECRGAEVVPLRLQGPPRHRHIGLVGDGGLAGGFEPRREAALVAEMEALSGTRFTTTFRSTLAALAALGCTRIAYGTPYSEATTEQGKRHLEAHGITVVSHGALANVRNIYEESEARAYAIARAVDRADADAVFLSGTGMPNIGVLKTFEDDLGKPVIAAASAMMWHALRVAGVRHAQPGYGRLFA